MDRKVYTAPPLSCERLVFFAKRSSTLREFGPHPYLGPKRPPFCAKALGRRPTKKHSKVLLKPYLKLHKGNINTNTQESTKTTSKMCIDFNVEEQRVKHMY